MNPIHYRRASLQYAESFRCAVATVAQERKFLASTEGFPAETALAFVGNIERNNLAQFYALDEDRVVGWCDIIPKSYEGLRHIGVLGMGVLSAYRKMGIGRTLLTMTIAHAKEQNGIEKVELEVFKSNVGAIRLYEEAGFMVEGERIRSRKLDNLYDNIILMGKEL